MNNWFISWDGICNSNRWTLPGWSSPIWNKKGFFLIFFQILVQEWHYLCFFAFFSATSVPYALSEFLFTMLSGSESAQIDEENSLGVNQEENTLENANRHVIAPHLHPLALRIDQSTRGRIQNYVAPREVIQQVK